MKPINPINRIPKPDTLTTDLYSEPLGFLVNLNTLVHWLIKLFSLENIETQISIFDLEGGEILKIGDEFAENKICINRPGILEGEIAIVSVCVD